VRNSVRRQAARKTTLGLFTNNNNPARAKEMRWFQGLAAALAAAQKDSLPVMAVLRRVGNLDDQKAVEKLASWPEVVKLSHEGLMAVRLSAEGANAEELTSKVR
jgi:hypothetical protein